MVQRLTHSLRGGCWAGEEVFRSGRYSHSGSGNTPVSAGVCAQQRVHENKRANASCLSLFEFL